MHAYLHPHPHPQTHTPLTTRFYDSLCSTPCAAIVIVVVVVVGGLHICKPQNTFGYCPSTYLCTKYLRRFRIGASNDNMYSVTCLHVMAPTYGCQPSPARPDGTARHLLASIWHKSCFFPRAPPPQTTSQAAGDFLPTAISWRPKYSVHLQEEGR